jgi:hypothetical protein
VRYISFFLLFLLFFSFQGVLIKNKAYECELEISWEGNTEAETLAIYVPVPESTSSQLVEVLSTSPECTVDDDLFTFTFENVRSAHSTLTFTIQLYTVVQEMETGKRAVTDRYAGIDYDHPAIIAKAEEITAGYRNDREKVEQIFQFVQRMAYEYNGEERTASWALEHMKGDCTESSFLFIALCEASGIEARPVWGWLPPDSSASRLSHLWAEVYLGEWYAVDPLQGNFYVFHPHITLNRGIIESNGEKSLGIFYISDSTGTITAKLTAKEIPYWKEKVANYLEFSCDGTACTEALELSAFPRNFPSLLCLFTLTFPILLVFAVRKYVEST